MKDWISNRRKPLLNTTITALSALIIGMSSNAYTKEKYLTIYALKGDSYEKMITDMSLNCSSRSLKRLNGDITPGKAVKIEIGDTGSLMTGYGDKVILDKNHTSLWSIARELTDKDIWREIRVLQRLNNIQDYRSIPKRRVIRTAKFRRLPDLDDILVRDYAVRGRSRVPSFKLFPSYLRHSLRKNGVFREQLKKRAIDMIILHTTEHGNSTFNDTLKYVQSRRSCHYIIDKDGKVYQIVKEKYKANGAGQSLWGGLYNLDFNSLNIEVFSNNDKGDNITRKQYLSLRVLIDDLRRRYKIDRGRILGHNQTAVSYKYMLRQRKGDPGKEFRWNRLGMDDNYRILDRDILSGRAGLNLSSSRRILYGQIKAYKNRSYARR